jgi:voltage-gated potassium channel
MAIEDWTVMDSLYMTVITLSTIGYGEVNPVSQPGRIFTLVLIVMGVGFFLYVIGNVVQFLVEGRIRLVLGRHKLDKQIGHLNNHYIVCGYGRMGRALCRYLIQKGLKFVVVEKNEDRIPVMNTDHVLYIAGEAAVEENLRKAGITRASNLIATLGTDADNVFLVLLAKGLNPNLYVVARASQNASKGRMWWSHPSMSAPEEWPMRSCGRMSSASLNLLLQMKTPTFILRRSPWQNHRSLSGSP